MKIARSALFLLAPSIAALVSAACSSSSSSSSEDDAGSALDSATQLDTSTGNSGDSASATDSRTDTGSMGGGDAAEAAVQPACGAAPARYTVLSDAGNGLVKDNTTDLVWMANSVGGEQSMEQTQTLAMTYCTGVGMRLPTESEALGIAAGNYSACAFGQWSTWTSTASPTSGDAWTVDYIGDTYAQLADNFPNGVLCVRAATGD